MGFEHIPVLLDECIEGLAIKPDGIYVDCTAGGGGHSFAIASHLTTGRLISIDRDQEAIEACTKRLEPVKDRVTVVKATFSQVSGILKQLEIDGVDGILMDLGVSSHQIDTPERGFSFRSDAKLDMRMDRQAPMSAKVLINTYGEAEIADILWRYGEERYSRQIARRIVQARQNGPIETTGQLVEIIKSAMPAAARREDQHPAKRTFQALRIAVNNELGELEETLTAIPSLLREGGRAAIISFHSLEDRMVKTAFREQSTGCTCPPEFPVCVCGHKAQMKIITKKPIVATGEQLEDNRRAACAKLRIAERI